MAKQIPDAESIACQNAASGDAFLVAYNPVNGGAKAQKANTI